MYYNKRVSFPIANGGLALRCIDSVYPTAFVCSTTASSTHLSDHFPEWIQTSIADDVHKITSINENISPYTTDHIMYCDQKILSNVPNGSLEGLNSPASILNKLVKLNNQKTIQLELDDQSPDEFLELYEPPIKYSSSQSALYQQLIDTGFDDFSSRPTKKPLPTQIIPNDLTTNCITEI